MKAFDIASSKPHLHVCWKSSAKHFQSYYKGLQSRMVWKGDPEWGAGKKGWDSNAVFQHFFFL